MLFLHAIVIGLTFHTTVTSTLGEETKKYCQPGEECWPTTEEIEQFKMHLSPTGRDCHRFPTFTSIDEPGSYTVCEL